mgnify:CR=1 FL=1
MWKRRCLDRVVLEHAHTCTSCMSAKSIIEVLSSNPCSDRVKSFWLFVGVGKVAAAPFIASGRCSRLLSTPVVRCSPHRGRSFGDSQQQGRVFIFKIPWKWNSIRLLVLGTEKMPLLNIVYSA